MFSTTVEMDTSTNDQTANFGSARLRVVEKPSPSCALFVNPFKYPLNATAMYHSL